MKFNYATLIDPWKEIGLPLPVGKYQITWEMKVPAGLTVFVGGIDNITVSPISCPKTYYNITPSKLLNIWLE